MDNIEGTFVYEGYEITARMLDDGQVMLTHSKDGEHLVNLVYSYAEAGEKIDSKISEGWVRYG